LISSRSCWLPAKRRKFIPSWIPAVMPHGKASIIFFHG
jgi:hypothetical protein